MCACSHGTFLGTGAGAGIGIGVGVGVRIGVGILYRTMCLWPLLCRWFFAWGKCRSVWISLQGGGWWREYLAVFLDFIDFGMVYISLTLIFVKRFY